MIAFDTLQGWMGPSTMDLLAMFDPLKLVQRWMSGEAGYFVLFGLLFSCGLGVPLPEDIPLLLAGYFVADGKMVLAFAAVAGWCGIIGGDCMLYLLGRRFGLSITKIPVLGSHVSVSRIEYAHKLFQHHGVWVIAVGRLFAGIRAAMVVAAGTLRFNFVKFVIADGAAAVVSGGLFMSLGYYAHKKLGGVEQIEVQIRHYQTYIFGGVAVLVIVFIGLKWRQSRREAHTALQRALERDKLLHTATNAPAPPPEPLPN